MENSELNNLTTRQKQNLMADAATSDPSLRAAGVTARFYDYGDVTDASGGTYPSFNAICNSWNLQLNKRMWSAEATRLMQKKADVVISPQMGVCNSPYSGFACEDPCLAAEYVKAFTDGIKDGGLTPLVECGFTPYDLRHMDEEYSDRAFHEYYMSPFADLGEDTAFMFPYKKFNGTYAAINTVNVNEFVHKYGKGGAVFVKNTDKENARAMMMQGNILYGSKYIDLKDLSEDKDTAENLCNEACSRAMEYALKVKAYREECAAQEREPIKVSPLDIAEQSCVLLKNTDNILPLKSGTSIAASGSLSKDVNAQKFAELLMPEIEEEEENKEKQVSYKVTASQGFDLTRDISPELAKEAATAAVKADCAVVFVGFDKDSASKTTTLPVNMTALYYEVLSKAKKVILVVSSDCYTDLSFAHSAAAILLCPSCGNSSLQAVANILTGKTCPSGKLSRTYYTDTDKYFNLLKNMRSGGGLKAGVFCGYRADPDRAVLYPFGYGLSYTQFKYSNLTCGQDYIKFSVTNTGNADGYEVAQVYAHKEDSAVAWPFKILIGFIKVFLKAGETKICKVKPSAGAYKVYADGKYVTEAGAYSIYVGTSSANLVLKGSLNLSGDKITQKSENRREYARSTGNIFSGGYTFGKVTKTTVKGKKPLAAGAVMAVIALLAVMLATVLQASGYINMFSVDITSLAILIPFISFVAATLILVLIGGVRVMASKNKGVIVSTGESKGADLPRNQYERLFAELYGPDKYKYDDEEVYFEPEKDEENEIEKRISNKDEFIGEYDPSVSFAIACERLNYFLSLNGIKSGMASARHIFSALAASRVVISQNTEGLEKIIANFFGTEAYSFNLKEIPDTYSLVKGGDEEFSAALQQAGENPDMAYFIALYGASEDEDIKAFEPFLNCAYVNVKTDISYVNEGKTEVVSVPANVWFILVPGEKGIAFTDKKLCNVASVMVADVVVTEPAEQTVTPKSIGYYQFKRMVDKLINYEGTAYSLDEDHCWKKIDRFVRFLSAKSSYSLGNPECLSIERYAATFLAGDGEQNGALDGAVACKIVLPASVAMAGKDDEDSDLSSAIGNIFDEYDEIQRVLNLCKRTAG